MIDPVSVATGKTTNEDDIDLAGFDFSGLNNEIGNLNEEINLDGFDFGDFDNGPQA